MRYFIVSLLCTASLTFVPIREIAAETINDKPEIVSLYARGKRMLRQESWLEAARVFEELAGRYSNSPNLDLFLFNRAKSHLHFGDYDKANAGFTAFIAQFSKSPLISHARFFRGNIAYTRGRAGRAVAEWIAALSGTDDERLLQLARNAITEAVRQARNVSLSPVDFAALPEERRCDLILSITRILVERNMENMAEKISAECTEKTGNNRRRSRAQDDELQIAVLLPFSGELAQFGEDIYNGAVIAAEQYRRETGRQIRLTRHDTQGDPINAARIIRGLIDSPADVVLGPLTSEAAAVAVAALGDRSLPLIAPAATEAGLTRLSESAFQLSPNIELEGIVMADYAAIRLQADSAAILTSTNRDHLRMARAFAERFTQQGGTVVAMEYYRPRDKDFGDYVRDIKNIILGIQPDSIFFVNEQGDTLDPDGLPAHVDCLFLPGNADQLRLLLPQIAFYRLMGELLGTDGWDDPSIYNLGDNVTHGAVFPSPFLKQSKTGEYLSFASAFDVRYGKQPQRLSSLGYDAVRLVTLSALRRGVSREIIRDELRSIADYSGAAAGVTFGPNRENIELPLYRMENGQAVPLSESDNAANDSETLTEQ